MGIWLIVKAAVLGIVEGLIEFLPVSSTGHLIIFGHILNFTGEFTKSFEVIIQLGSVLAIVILYKSKILGAFKNLKKASWGRKFFLNIVVAVLPALIMAALFSKVIKSFFDSVLIVAVSLIIGAVILYLAENYMLKRKVSQRGDLIKDDINEITIKDALIVGIFQCLALIPGMSRSGSTISGGLIRSMSSSLAAEFSFFLAIPIMLGAFIFEISDLVISSWVEIAALIVGFGVSFISAYFVVKVFIDFLGRRSLKGFVYYRLAVGIALIVMIISGVF